MWCTDPAEIEKKSMAIIAREAPELQALSEEERAVVLRLIHTSADFDYAKNTCFSDDAIERGLLALRRKAVIVTDTNMALAGISRAALGALSCEAVCFMAEDTVIKQAKERGITRAAVSMELAAERFFDRTLIFAVGNAPTALLSLVTLYREKKIDPALVIAMPVGFVNVVEAKELLMQSGLPYICAAGRKGGSGIAAACVNALLYQLYDRESV